MPCIDTVQGFSFCPAAYQPRTSVYSGFSAANAIIQPKRQNHLQGFAAAFPLIRPIPAHTIQQMYKLPIHRLRNAGWHTVKCCTSTNTRYHRHAGRCTGATCPPTIIMYIRVQRCAPVVDLCQAVQHSADHASPAASRCFSRPAVCGLALGQRSERTRPAWRPPPGGAVQQQEQGGRRGTIDGYRRISFSGFRPIANRGQQ